MPRTIRKKVKVPLYGQPAGRVANIEDGATMGATIGRDLYFDDGSIVTLANLAAALGVDSSSSSSTSSLGSLSVTLWRLIREVPIYTTGTTDPEWIYTLDGDPIGTVGFAAAAEGIAPNTLAGDLVLAPVDGRVFIPVTSGNTALFIDGDVGGATTPLIMLDNTGAAADRRLLRIRETDTLDRGFNLDGILTGDNADNALSWGSDFTGSIARAFKFWADGRVGFANEAFMFDPADGPEVSLTIAGGTSDAHVLISSALDVVLELRADTNNSGENDNPYVLFSQDGGGVLARIGLTGDANLDPSGASFSGCLANSLALHHPEPGGAIALGTENAVAFLINTTNENVFLTAARFTAATAIEIESTLPLLMFDETDAAANERQWHMRTSGGVFRLDTYTDAGVLGANAIFIDRAGTTVSEIELNATLLDFNGNLDVSGTGVFAGDVVQITNTAGVELRLVDSDSGTGTQQMGVRNSGGQFRVISRTDAGVFVENLLSANVNSSSLWTSLTISADLVALDSGAPASFVVGNTSNPFSGIAAMGTGAGSFLTSARYSASASQPATVQLAKSRNTTIGSHTIVQSGDLVGLVAGYGSDGTNYINAAGVGFVIEGTPGTNDMPGAIVFYTTADGSASLSERGRFTQDGRLQLSTSTGNASPALDIANINPTAHWRETDAAADNRVWFLNVRSEQFLGGVINDANDAANLWLTVDRTGVSIDSIQLSTTGALTWQINVTSGLATALGNNSTAAVAVSSGGAGTAGDVYFRINASGHVAYSVGVDRSDGTNFQVVPSATIDGAAPILQITSAGIHIMSAYGAGTATFDASGVISSVSDERIKTAIKPFTRGLAEVLQIRPISHRYTKDSGLDTKHRYAGFSAQNVERSIPEAIGRMKSGLRTLQDRALIAGLVNAVRELSGKVDRLEDELRRAA